MPIIMLLALLFSHQILWANSELVEGRILKASEGIFITLDQEISSLRLYSNDRSTLRDLSRLETGDFLSGLGRLHSRNHMIYVSSINYVGLKRLLGSWVAHRGPIFHFLDFSKMKILERTRPPTRSKAVNFDRQSVRYRVSPDAGEKWTLFLYRGNAVELGSLEFKDSDEIEIEFIGGQGPKKYSLKRSALPTYEAL